MSINKTSIYFTAILSALFLLFACDITSNKGSGLLNNNTLLLSITEQDGRACLREDDIRGFGILDDDVISVESRRRGEYYLLTTLYHCPSIQFSPKLAFSASFNELCGGGGRASVISGDEICPIRNIFKFENRQQAFDAFAQVEEKRAQLKEEIAKEEIAKEEAK
ncbi:DUF6491 family protein [Glaciecola petra]|uniref:DUF6491 family protein n=1 Tax=Glaciecola petra TaxID=3075602 RepID=A0ABU2ZV64_9ALTE|nr:DUF6491 family protein [Aestuariibacter sp. P117]MDT0596500.1 DUF6491 family protein [Aestuariibacter sp. P117]